MPVAVGAMAALAKAGGAETDFRVSLGEIGAVALGTGDAGEGTPARSAVAGGAAPGPEAAVSADTGRSAGKVASAPGGKDAAPPSGKVAAAPSGKDVLPVLHSEVTGGVASDKPRAHTGLARAGVSAKEHGGSSAVKKTGDDIPIADSSSVPGSCALAVPASCVADTPAEPLAAGETAAEAPVGSAGGTAGQRPVAQARVQAAAGSKAPGGERFHPVNDEGAGSTDSAARPAGAPVELAGGVKVADGTSAETVAVAGKEHAGNVSLSAIGVTHAPPAEVVGGAVHDPHALPSRESQAPAAVAEPVPAADWPGEAKTLSATPQVLEVGVASGTHGWLRVRAELGHGRRSGGVRGRVVRGRGQGAAPRAAGARRVPGARAGGRGVGGRLGNRRTRTGLKAA